MTRRPDSADAKKQHQRVPSYDHPPAPSALPPGPRSSLYPSPYHHQHPPAPPPPASSSSSAHPALPPIHPPHYNHLHHHHRPPSSTASAQAPPPPLSSTSPTSGRLPDHRPRSYSHSQLPMPVPSHHAPEPSSDPSRYQQRPPPGPQGPYAYYPPPSHYSNESPTTPSQPTSAVDPRHHYEYRPPHDPAQHSPYPPSGGSTPHPLAMHQDPRGYAYPPGPAPPPGVGPPPQTGPPPGPQQAPYDPYYSDMAGGPGETKRKAVRASQACESCRSKKCKCDEERPVCGNCAQNGTECQYRNLPPPKQERNMMQVIDQISAIGSQITEMRNYFSAAFVSRSEMDGFRQEFRDLRDELRTVAIKKGSDHTGSPLLRTQHGSPIPGELVNGRLRHGSLPNGREGSARSPQDPASAKSTPQQVHYRNMPPPSKSSSERLIDDDIRRFDPLGGQLSIPTEHTTAAHKLLIAWDAIRPFYEGIIDQDHVKNYVWHEETQRGQLRLFGQGEGHDGLSAGDSPPGMSNQMAIDHSTPEHGILGDGAWGFGFDSPLETPFSNAGGLNSDGTLCLDYGVCHRLFKSFMDNIWVMHPIFNPRSLNESFDKFARRYCRDDGSSGPSMSESADVKHEVPHKFRATKRKRSDGEDEHDSSHYRHGSASESRRRPVERSINNAVMLLVFALGRICEHKDPVPAPVNPNQAPHEQPETLSNGTTAGSAGRYARKPRNVDKIPGAAYYAYAIGILGEQYGAPDLAHVHGRLLAGLFMGQMARAIDSWSWIHAACTACKLLFRDEQQLERECEPERADAIRFAYWTCLQLESDLLAEFSELPHSGISRHEEVMPLPRWSTLDYAPDSREQKIMTYYLSQIHLRKILNRAHSALYNTGKDSLKNPGWTIFTAEDLALQLSDWKNSLPPGMSWNDEDEPATEINDARLRAKYYGAQYMIHRPFLHHLLQDELAKPTHEIRKLIQLRTQEKEGVVSMARKCIAAAVKSTLAFDGLRGRPIVTGIFGTAHAQFGNVLVLAACSTSAKYRWFTNRIEILNLITRTADFVGRLAPLAPTMATNQRILWNTHNILRSMYGAEGSEGPEGMAGAATGGSFSSSSNY